MAHAGNAQRKARHKKQFASRARLLGLARKNMEVLNMAITEHDKAAHLAKILSFVIAANGGALTITKANLDALPATTKLQSMYDKESESFVFVTSMAVDTEETSAIEVVTPKIEVVSA
jgi:acetylglutamate synthase